MTGRGKKAAAKKDAVEEAHVAENKEMKKRGKKAQPPAKKKQKDKMVSEPEVAEKKDHDKKAHPSADSASQVASEVDNPDKINLTGVAGTSGGRTFRMLSKKLTP